MIGGIVTMLSNVEPLTTATDVSTSRPNFVANIETIAATGADAPIVIANIMLRSSPCRNGYIIAITMSGYATSRIAVAT